RFGNERRDELEPQAAHLWRDPHILNQWPAIYDDLWHRIVEQQPRSGRQPTLAERNVKRTDLNDALIQPSPEIRGPRDEADVLSALPAEARLAGQGVGDRKAASLVGNAPDGVPLPWNRRRSGRREVIAGGKYWPLQDKRSLLRAGELQRAERIRQFALA